MTERFKAQQGSHETMEGSVLDTSIPADGSDDYPWFSQIFCACWTFEDAEYIARALNEMEARKP